MASPELTALSKQWGQQTIAGNTPGAMQYTDGAGATMTPPGPIPTTPTPETPVNPQIPVSVVEGTTTGVEIPPADYGQVAPYSAPESLLNEYNAAMERKKALEGQRDPYVDNIRTLYGGMMNLGQDYLNALGTKGGVNDQQDKLLGEQRYLADLNQRSRDMQTAYDKTLSDTEFQMSERGGTKTAYNAYANRQTREYTFQQRAISSQVAAQAAVVEAMQGNIKAATDHIQYMMDLKYKSAQEGLEQEKYFLDKLDSQVSDEQKNALDLKKMQIQDELDAIKRAKEAVSNAVASGVATAKEIAEMSNPKLSPTQQEAMANQIMGRAAASDRELERLAKTSQIAAARLGQQKDLLELAKAGDPAARAQYKAAYGYDPFDMPATGTQIAEYETKKATLNADIDRATELLGDTFGIKVSTGAYQPGFWKGMFTSAPTVDLKGEGTFGVFSPANMFKYVPIVGNIIAGSATKTQKDDFLNGISYITNNQTFEKLMTLKEGGATFGALSDSERVAIGRAASDLAASVDVDQSGNIIGIKGSPEKFVENLGKVLEGYKAASDQLNIDYGITGAEKDEAAAVWNSQ